MDRWPFLEAIYPRVKIDCGHWQKTTSNQLCWEVVSPCHLSSINTSTLSNRKNSLKSICSQDFHRFFTTWDHETPPPSTTKESWNPVFATYIICTYSSQTFDPHFACFPARTWPSLGDTWFQAQLPTVASTWGPSHGGLSGIRSSFRPQMRFGTLRSWRTTFFIQHPPKIARQNVFLYMM